MTILTRRERERLVLDLYYNQGKTYRQIAKEARISPSVIGVILNKIVEEKDGEVEGIKQLYTIVTQLQRQMHHHNNNSHQFQQQQQLLQQRSHKKRVEAEVPISKK